MGSSKSLSSTAMAYIEYIKREVLRKALEYTVKDRVIEDSVKDLMGEFGVSEKFATARVKEALQVFQEEGNEAFRNSIRIISTNHLNFPYTHFDRAYFVEHLEDEELEDCILQLDEAYLFLDSRRTTTKDNLLFQYFVAQTRKRNVDLYLCCLHRDMVDKRIRRWINIRGTCRFNKGPMEENLPVNKRRFNWATVTFTNLDSGMERRMRFYGPAFWGLYDTEERVPFTRRQMEIEVS
jgi:hypothetical protein